MPLAKKLNLKPGMKMRLVNAPSGFDPDDVPTAKAGDAVMVFAKNKAELAKHGAPAFEAARADGLAWIAYPKAGQLDTDLSRDILWKEVDGQKIQPVRQVALDEVWSALRFRPKAK
jgi:hypothetical protein